MTFATGSLAAECPQCGAPLVNPKAATETGVGDGLRMTVTLFRAAVRDLAARDRDELVALRAELERLRVDHDAAGGEDLLRRMGLPSQANRMELLTILSIIVALVIGLRSSQAPAPTHDEIERIVVNVTNQIQGESDCTP